MTVPQLVSQEYVGRLLLMGRDLSGQFDILGYAITGRSVSSRARRLVWAEDGALHTEVTQPELLLSGNPKLLLYPCLRRYQDHWLISNGMQTDLLYETAHRRWQQGQSLQALAMLVEAHARPAWVTGNRDGEFMDLTSFEPDAPTYTPRICGVLGPDSAAMSVVKSVHGQAMSSFFSLPLRQGHGFFISTYAGINVPPGEPIPAFSGEPIDITIAEETPESLAQSLFASLGPKSSQPGIIQPDVDFRVAVAILFVHRQHHHVRSSLVHGSHSG